MSRKRKHISDKIKLAAALLQMKRHVLTDDGGCRLEYVISHDEAKTMTADQIIARFHFDHDPITHAEDGPDEPWNLTPRFRSEHAAKTAKVDIPGIAKRKRVAKAEAEFRARLLTPREELPPRRSAFPKGRKLQSRKFQRRTTDGRS